MFSLFRHCDHNCYNFKKLTCFLRQYLPQKGKKGQQMTKNTLREKNCDLLPPPTLTGFLGKPLIHRQLSPGVRRSPQHDLATEGDDVFDCDRYIFCSRLKGLVVRNIFFLVRIQ